MVIIQSQVQNSMSVGVRTKKSTILVKSLKNVAMRPSAKYVKKRLNCYKIVKNCYSKKKLKAVTYKTCYKIVKKVVTHKNLKKSQKLL